MIKIESQPSASQVWRKFTKRFNHLLKMLRIVIRLQALQGLLMVLLQSVEILKPLLIGGKIFSSKIRKLSERCIIFRYLLIFLMVIQTFHFMNDTHFLINYSFLYYTSEKGFWAGDFCLSIYQHTYSLTLWTRGWRVGSL